MRTPRPSSMPVIVSWIILLLLSMAPPAAGGQEEQLPVLRKDLERAARLEDWGTVTSLIDEIAGLGTPEAVETLLKVALALENEEVFDAVQTALASVRGEEAVDLCVRLLRKDRTVGKKLSRWELRVTVAEAFGSREDEATYAPLVAALEDSALPVRLQAIRSLGKRGERRAVPALIDVLEREQGSPGILWEETHAVLKKLTGKDLAEAVDWRNWWEAHGEKASPPPPAEPGESEGGEEPDPKATVSDSPTFFGVEIVSKRIVFLIDVSGSMAMWDEGEVDGEAPKGSSGGGDGYSVSRTRIHRAKTELIRVVRALRPEVRFNIITFSHELTYWRQGKLAPATKKNKASAVAWARELRADGGTATDEALDAAFQDKEANTFILLADGVVAKPSGDNPTSDEIIRRVREQNRFRKVRILSFGFDGDGNPAPGTERHPLQSPARVAEFRAMMQQLAEETDGKYTSIR